MIKTKNLVILVVVLIILLGVSLMQKANYRRSTSGSAETVVLEGTLASDELSRITISFGLEADVVDLTSTDDGWVVASAWNATVNEKRIDTLLGNLADLAGEFRSDEESVVADYGLGGSNSVRIRAFGPGGDEILALDVGNKSERSQGQFIKVPNHAAVYLTQKSILSDLGLYDGPGRPKATHFMELQSVKEDRLQVDRILLEDGNDRIEMAKVFGMTQPAADDTTGAQPTIDRSTWEWKSAAKSLAKTKADGVLSALVSIRAVDVDNPAGDLEAFGLSTPAKRATLFFEDGHDLALEFGSTREASGDLPAGIWMRIQGEPTVWVVTDYAVNNAFKKLEDLMPTE